MAKIRLVCFDFDGTLIDTAPDLIRATNLYLKSKGLEPLPEARIRGEIGMGLRRLILDVYPGDLDEDGRKRVEAEFLQVYEREFLTSPAPFEGALEFLQNFDGEIAIVSNKRMRFILPILQKLELDRLPWVKIVGGDTYPNMKPHPEPFLAAIQAAGVSPEETLIVGDGHPDVRGALAIESRCVAVSFGYTPVEELMDLGAWSRIDSFLNCPINQFNIVTCGNPQIDLSGLLTLHNILFLRRLECLADGSHHSLFLLAYSPALSAPAKATTPFRWVFGSI
ncbi:MAG: HAD hydrolase-like protein [Calothrix sp. SM1_5_4]|nr:HAD hydrolase-like protein [Calothrix sp. SM1_5_4]